MMALNLFFKIPIVLSTTFLAFACLILNVFSLLPSTAVRNGVINQDSNGYPESPNNCFQIKFESILENYSL